MRLEEPPTQAAPADEATREEVLQAVRPRKRERWFTFASYFSPLVILLIWEGSSRGELIDQRFFPPPSSIIDTFWEQLTDGRLPEHVRATLKRVAVGYAMGAIPAVALGILLGTFRWPRQIVTPIFAALYPIPKIAIFPLLLLIFGIGDMSKQVAVAIGVFFLVFYNTLSGVLQVPQIYTDVARSSGASRLQTFRTVSFPASLPNIFTGLRLAAGTAFIVIAAAEFVGARSGLGYFIWISWTTLAVSKMYVGIVVISVLGYIATLAITLLERRVVRWSRH
jgi:NitT/TauT family transport system permease protein